MMPLIGYNTEKDARTSPPEADIPEFAIRAAAVAENSLFLLARAPAATRHLPAA